MSKVTYYQTAADRIVASIRGDGVNRRSVSALARAIGEPRETVSGWLRHPHRMPLHGAIALLGEVGMSAEDIAQAIRGRS